MPPPVVTMITFEIIHFEHVMYRRGGMLVVVDHEHFVIGSVRPNRFNLHITIYSPPQFPPRVAAMLRSNAKLDASHQLVRNARGWQQRRVATNA